MCTPSESGAWREGGQRYVGRRSNVYVHAERKWGRQERRAQKQAQGLAHLLAQQHAPLLLKPPFLLDNDDASNTTTTTQQEQATNAASMREQQITKQRLRCHNPGSCKQGGSSKNRDRANPFHSYRIISVTTQRDEQSHRSLFSFCSSQVLILSVGHV